MGPRGGRLHARLERPGAAAGGFPSVPLWVDLRWARTEEHISLRNPVFRDAVADLAATLHGVSKDDLVSEDIRLHRRAMRLARAAVLALTILVILVAAAGLLAVLQRNA